MTRGERQGLIDRADPHLSIVRQCQPLKVARSALYYRPSPVSDDDLVVMRRLDEQYLVTPFYGARWMAAVLRRDGFVVNRNFRLPTIFHPLAIANSILIRRDKPLQMTVLPGGPSLALAR
jgi:hypothetical protein